MNQTFPDGTISCNLIDTFYGGNTQKLLGKSHLIQNPIHEEGILACVADESSTSVSYYDNHFVFLHTSFLLFMKKVFVTCSQSFGMSIRVNSWNDCKAIYLSWICAQLRVEITNYLHCSQKNLSRYIGGNCKENFLIFKQCMILIKTLRKWILVKYNFLFLICSWISFNFYGMKWTSCNSCNLGATSLFVTITTLKNPLPNS